MRAVLASTNCIATMDDSQVMTTTWAETEGIMAEIKSLYSDSDDAQIAAQAASIARTTEESCAAKQADAKKSVPKQEHIHRTNMLAAAEAATKVRHWRSGADS